MSEQNQDPKTPAQYLNETSFIIIDGRSIKSSKSFNNYILTFYNDNDERIITIAINQNQTNIIIDYIINNHSDISVYDPDLSNILVPSNKQLYEALYS